MTVFEPRHFPDQGLPPPAVHPGQGDLVVAADDGYFFSGHVTAEAAAAAPVYLAGHGHAPSLAALAAAFVMAGPGVREGVDVDSLSMLDVAPTAARLLGVELPAAQGAPVAATLAGA